MHGRQAIHLPPDWLEFRCELCPLSLNFLPVSASIVIYMGISTLIS